MAHNNNNTVSYGGQQWRCTGPNTWQHTMRGGYYKVHSPKGNLGGMRATTHYKAGPGHTWVLLARSSSHRQAMAVALAHAGVL